MEDLSDNSPVCNITKNGVISDDFLIDDAEDYANIINKCLNQLILMKPRICIGLENKWIENERSSENINFSGRHSKILEKFQRDKTCIIHLLKQTLMHLQSKHGYDILKKKFNRIIVIAEKRRNLEMNERNWKEQLLQLNQLIVDEKNKNEAITNQLSALIQKSAARIEKEYFSCKPKLDFTEKWEQSRLYQQTYLLEIKEQIYQEKLNIYLQQENLSETTFDEIESYLHSDIREKEEKIDLWSKRYADEIDQKQEDIEYFNERIKDIKDSIERKSKIYSKRQVFLDNFKKRRKLADIE